MYRFDRCDGTYFEDTYEEQPIGNYIRFMEIWNSEKPIYFADDEYYLSSCDDGYYKQIVTPYPTREPTSRPTGCGDDCTICADSTECNQSNLGCVYTINGCEAQSCSNTCGDCADSTNVPHHQMDVNGLYQILTLTLDSVKIHQHQQHRFLQIQPLHRQPLQHHYQHKN